MFDLKDLMFCVFTALSLNGTMWKCKKLWSFCVYSQMPAKILINCQKRGLLGRLTLLMII